MLKGKKIDIKNVKSIIKDKIGNTNQQIDGFLENKGLLEYKELAIINIRDSLILIILLIISIFTIYKGYFIFDDFIKEYKNDKKQYYGYQKDIKEMETKIQFNLFYKDFSNQLQYGTEIKEASGESFYIPNGGYLSQIDNIFPRIEDLDFLTFIEGWLSDFEDINGEKIRLDNNILKSFNIVGEIPINNDVKKIIFNLNLEGETQKINHFINTITNLKIQSNIESYKEKEIKSIENLTSNGNIVSGKNVDVDFSSVQLNIAYYIKNE